MSEANRALATVPSEPGPSADASEADETPPTPAVKAVTDTQGWHRRRSRSRSSLFAAGEPMLWLTGGGLAICAVMVAGLLALVLWKGLATFWPLPLVKVTTWDGQVYMGEITRDDDYRPATSVLDALPESVAPKARQQVTAQQGWAHRKLFRTGNFRLTQSHFQWVDAFAVAEETRPEWAMTLERLEWGRFYGFPEAFVYVHEIPRQAKDGRGLSSEEILREARELERRLKADSKHPLRWLDKRWLDGRDQEVLLPLDELEEGVQPLALVEMIEGPEAAWRAFNEHHDEVRARWRQRRKLEKFDTGEVNHRQEQARLALRQAELDRAAIEDAEGAASGTYARATERVEKARQSFEEVKLWADEEFARIRREIDQINHGNARFQLLMLTSGEGTMKPQTTLLRLDDIVRAYPANQLSLGQKLAIYVARWKEFLVDEPREANSEGGVYPAIFGTVAMTLIMSILVVPFGVLAALYLREYAKGGAIVSTVRIAVNNLAGVPSIVFGVFGLGFFCYVMGASIDELFFSATLPNPTFGKGGLMWASFTLALLTLPVVIVATEEAVSAVPSSMREGSYACGASKWQTIQRIVLPRALPGIITGMILAIARGAGEVAPLMLVGAVKLAPELPIDGTFPYVHPERSFMHLGFHIFDVGFQSQNSEAAKPMVFTTTLLLIVIVALLNIVAIWLRSRLRKRFAAGQF